MKSNLFKKYQGVVLYIDVLGFSALSQNKINLSKSDYNPWFGGNEDFYNNTALAFNILIEIRKLTSKLKRKLKTIKVSMISDSIFIWSDNPVEMLSFTSCFMSEAIRKGVFCRCGLASGDIIEEKNKKNDGTFLLGDAVVKAVELERTSKGCRVFFNDDLPAFVHEKNKSLNWITNDLFCEIIDPVTFNYYDEYKWYLYPDLPTSLQTFGKKEKINATKKRLLLANEILRSPKFSWNANNEQGKLHLKASVNFLSERDILNVRHNWNWTSLSRCRNYNHLKEVSDEIKRGEYIVYDEMQTSEKIYSEV